MSCNSRALRVAGKRRRQPVRAMSLSEPILVWSNRNRLAVRQAEASATLHQTQM